MGLIILRAPLKNAKRPQAERPRWSRRAPQIAPPLIPPIVTAGCSFIGGCTPWLQRDTLLLFFYFVRLNWLFTYCPSPTAGCDVRCTHSCAVPQTLLFYIMKTIASENVFNQQNSNRDFPSRGLFISSESRHTTCCVGAEHLSHFVMVRSCVECCGAV